KKLNILWDIFKKFIYFLFFKKSFIKNIKTFNEYNRMKAYDL
ncbi:hypothetical protein AAJ76_2600052178, partial [Vairimorpha ceranae]